jgi:hypothetical protein
VVIEGRDMRDHLVLMHLAATGKERGHGGDAEAAADIAHQVVDAGGVAHLLARYARHAGGHQRDEQERHGRTLDHLRPKDVPVAGVEGEVREAEPGPASDEEADGDEFARIEAVGKLAGDGHHDERPDAARREGQSRFERRIAEQRLEEYGQQQAAIEHEAQHGHKADAGREGAVLKHTQIDDGMPGPELADDRGDQTENAERGKDADRRAAEPVFALSGVEDNLQNAEAERQMPHRSTLPVRCLPT